MKRKHFFNTNRIIIAVLLVLFLLFGCQAPTEESPKNNALTESNATKENDTDDKGDKEIPSKSESKDDTSKSEDKIETDSSETADADDKNQATSSSQGSDKTEANSNTNTNTNSDNQSSNNNSSSNNSSNTNSAPKEEEDTPSTDTPAPPTSDPYVDVDKAEFYANYQPATNLADALYRSQHGFLSGSLDVPGQYAQDASYRPMENGMYVRNTGSFYADDGNTYIVVDASGNEVMRIFKGGAYITLEEVAAYMYAFGGSKDNIPANYTSSKNTKPTASMWGEYLRVNHSYFTGDTYEYPYEPELPNISGCGGSLQYWELDIGTTGTTTPGYKPYLYNNGTRIKRGAARLVYARQDLNGNGSYEQNEVYVFYTHNHYNDFREYLNYYGGWGEMFGNVTGGGEYSSKTNCNPTPYVPTSYRIFS